MYLSVRALARITGLAFVALLFAPTTAGGASAGQAAYIEGIDVSHFQGSPNWDAVSHDGIEFVFAKATEGRTISDDQYATNRANAEAAGVRFGAYHFARPSSGTNDAVMEADHFLDTAALAGRQLLPVLDLEDSGGLGARELRAWTKAWLGRVRDRLGVKALIYTSPNFWKDHMGDTASFANNGYRLWIAHWGAGQPNVPAQNWGGRGWTIWQYDDCGSVSGIQGCVDRDHLTGTVGALKIKNNR